jgi:DNA-binding transcriptional LysR family regulator
VNTGPILDADLDIRSLRYFVAVAEELHFTRAAARIFVAQQALSREIQRFERQLGSPLFARTTRQVTLTPEGRRLLPRARELVALHDLIRAEIREPARPILVDFMSGGRRTGSRILDAVRDAAPELEFRRRYGGGVGAAIVQLRAAELDIAFGRADWRSQTQSPGIERELVRFEPLGLLLPAEHSLARGEVVRVASLRQTEIDVNLANPDAPEWADLTSQFLDLAGAHATSPHVPAVGLREQADHLARQGLPILTTFDHVAVPGGVIRRLIEPVPIYPWSMLWRPGIRPAALAAIREAITTLAAANGWLTLPSQAWVPEPEASSLAH